LAIQEYDRSACWLRAAASFAAAAFCGTSWPAGPETEARFVVDPGWESVTFLLSPQDVREHLAARQREHEFHVPRGIEALQADPDGARGLFAWGKRLATTAARQPAIFNEGKNERRGAEVEFVRDAPAGN
jgi:hypothetical protein